MRRDAFAMLVAVLVILCMAPMGRALGQTGAGEMKDVAAMKLKASGFGEAAKACGLDRAMAIDAFIGPLRVAGLEIVPQASGYWLLLRVTTIPWHDDTCVSYVETGVLASAILGSGWPIGGGRIRLLDQHARFPGAAEPDRLAGALIALKGLRVIVLP
jgi:hypothetical protein